jgi:hypothetical protein
MSAVLILSGVKYRFIAKSRGEISIMFGDCPATLMLSRFESDTCAVITCHSPPEEWELQPDVPY